MSFLNRTFGALDPKYLIRAYVLSAAFMALMVWMLTYSTPPSADKNPLPMLIYFSIGALVFPFSKLVWDEMKRVMMGGNVFYLNAILLLFCKLIINYLLWSFALFIAPIGMAYLWLRSRHA